MYSRRDGFRRNPRGVFRGISSRRGRAKNSRAGTAEQWLGDEARRGARRERDAIHGSVLRRSTFPRPVGMRLIPRFAIVGGLYRAPSALGGGAELRTPLRVVASDSGWCE